MGAAGDASTWAASSQLLQAARSIVSHMAGANAAKKRAAPSQLEATRVPCNLEWNANDYVFASLESITGACTAHGGGRRCQHLGCPKAAVSCGTQHCQAHGGGKRCQQDGCSKAVAKAPGSTLCTLCLRAAQPQPYGA
jgi:hypothetical protein